MPHIFKAYSACKLLNELSSKSRKWSGERQELIQYWVSCRTWSTGNSQRRASGRLKCAYTEESVAAARNGHSAKKASHKFAIRHVRYQDRRVSPSPVLCISYTVILDWNVKKTPRAKWSQLPHFHHAGFVATKQSLPQADRLQNLWHNSATSPPDKSAGCEWFEAASDWCVG